MCYVCFLSFFFSSRRRHTRCALVTGVQTCALPIFNDHFIQQDVDELNAVVQALKRTLATLPPDIAPAELNQRFANAVSGHHNAEYRISSEAGVQIYASPGSNLDRFARIARPVENITIETVGIWKDHGATFRGAVLRTTVDNVPGSNKLTIAVATGINFHLHYLESFRDYLRIITIAACLIAILATWFVVHQGHAPIRRISRQIRSIGSDQRSEEHTSELQSLMRISYAVFCLKKK